jgi:hypothetical protein
MGGHVRIEGSLFEVLIVVGALLEVRVSVAFHWFKTFSSVKEVRGRLCVDVSARCSRLPHVPKPPGRCETDRLIPADGTIEKSGYGTAV